MEMEQPLQSKSLLERRIAFPADVLLDTDAYNEVDDQFAIAYLLQSAPELRVRALTAAPFLNEKSADAAGGMEKSHEEIRHILRLMGRGELLPDVYRGAGRFLPDEHTPVPSEAADCICRLAKEYTAHKPLYIVAIGAVTNVASALLMDPAVKERAVVVWLGGDAPDWPDPCGEFNMAQDIAAARVVFASGVPLVWVPCKGVASAFSVSEAELLTWLDGKNALCDYLVSHTRETASRYAAGKPWTRVLWDVTAVAWLLGPRFVKDKPAFAPVPEYDLQYGQSGRGALIRYCYGIDRDALAGDLFAKLTGNGLPKEG